MPPPAAPGFPGGLAQGHLGVTVPGAQDQQVGELLEKRAPRRGQVEEGGAVRGQRRGVSVFASWPSASAKRRVRSGLTSTTSNPLLNFK